MPRKINSFPKERKKKDHSHRRYVVAYDLIYDGGSSEWDGFYRTYVGARIAMWWNRKVASWGGMAVLYEQDSWNNGQRNRKGL